MKIQGQYKQILQILIGILFLISVFVAGRLGYIYELYRSKPVIQVVDELNVVNDLKSGID